MKHHHFKYLRNFIAVFVALVIAGYPYLFVATFFYRPERQFFLNGILILTILLISFSAVAYAAHNEHKRRQQKEKNEFPSE